MGKQAAAWDYARQSKHAQQLVKDIRARDASQLTRDAKALVQELRENEAVPFAAAMIEILADMVEEANG